MNAVQCDGLFAVLPSTAEPLYCTVLYCTAVELDSPCDSAVVPASS